MSSLHSHIAVWATVSKRAPLLLKGDEVPYGHHGVVRHIEVEQFHTCKGVESIQLTRRAGEVFSHKKAICREQNQKKVSLNICEDTFEKKYCCTLIFHDMVFICWLQKVMVVVMVWQDSGALCCVQSLARRTEQCNTSH